MQAGDVIGERYEVVRQVAKRDAGAVFQGRDRVLGDAVAIKLVEDAPTEFVERLRLEAAILRTIDHPHVARFLDYGTSGSSHYLVERWVEGITLRRRLDTAGLTPREAVAMARQLASALAEAHRFGVIHRDVKPSNLLGAGDDWFVIDFGMARVIGDQIQRTHAGAVVGTVGYMSPEQACAVRDLDARADVFSFGCVLYEALAGAAAFDGDSQLAIQAKLIVADPPMIDTFVPGLPEPLIELIHGCLHKLAPGRPSDGAALVAALDAIELADIPVFPPRKVRRREPPTVPSPTVPKMSVVLTAPRPELTPLTLVAWRELVAKALARFPGTIAVMPTGSIVFVTSGHAGVTSVNVAASVVLALLPMIPDTPMSICSAHDQAELDPLLDAAGGAVERAGIASLFAEGTHTSRGARLDALTVGHLGGEYQLVTIDGVCYLAGLRGPLTGPTSA